MVSSATFISDTVKFVRNDLRTNITDPISAARSGRDQFVITSYPQRDVKYPQITIRHAGSTDIRRLGMQSESHFIRIPLEIRIWARNEKERDELTEQVYNRLRGNQLSGSGTSNFEQLHDFKQVSSVQVDETVGKATIKSQVLEIEYTFIAG